MNVQFKLKTMPPGSIRRLAWAAIGACAFVFGAAGAPLAVGDAVPPISAKDQFGKEFKLDSEKPRFLLIGLEMGASKSADIKLAALGAGWLEKHQAAYLVDIHKMPSFARVFALPKLKKYPERMVLIEDEKTLAGYPQKPGSITVLVLAENKVREIRFWKPATEPIDGVLK